VCSIDVHTNGAEDTAKAVRGDTELYEDDAYTVQDKRGNRVQQGNGRGEAFLRRGGVSKDILTVIGRERQPVETVDGK